MMKMKRAHIRRLYKKGEIYYQCGNYTAALGIFRDLLRADDGSSPLFSEIYRYKALCLQHVPHFTEALARSRNGFSYSEKIIQQATMQNRMAQQTSAKVTYRLGYHLFTHPKCHKKAYRLLNRSIELGLKNPEVFYLRGILLKSFGKEKEAKRDFDVFSKL